MNPAAVVFADRFSPLYHDARPNFYHAGIYSAVTHYLNAAAAMGVDKAKASGRAVVEQMKSMPVTDDSLWRGPNAGRWQVRAQHVCLADQDAGGIHGDWDFFKLLHTIPADQAFKPMAGGGCPLVKS